MSENLGPYLAEEIAEWAFDGVDIDPSPGTVHVAIFDNTDTEVTGDFANGRVAMATTDWTELNATEYENSVDIEFGEALVDVNNIESIAVYDSGTVGGGNELFRGLEDDAPFDVAEGSTYTIATGELTVDVLEFTT